MSAQPLIRRTLRVKLEGEGGGYQTGHVKAISALLDPDSAVRTRFGDCADQLLRRPRAGPHLTVVLAAGKTLVPNHLMAETHLRLARVALEVRTRVRLVKHAVLA